MTKMIRHMVAAGALLVLNGAVAVAQSDMKLDVPFAFQTPSAQLPAGKYFVSEIGGFRSAPFYRLQHAETGKTTLLVAPGVVGRKRTMGELPAQVAFKCVSDVCAISEIYPAGSDRGFTIPVKIKDASKPGAVATVRIPAAAE